MTQGAARRQRVDLKQEVIAARADRDVRWACLSIALAMVSLALAVASTVGAATPSGADLDAPTKALVERLVLERAASLATAQRRADEGVRGLLTQLAQKDKALRSQQIRTSAVERELEAVTAERWRLIGEIEDRDAQFKIELAAYRRAVVGLASSPSPERRVALERYADGDRTGAFPILQELTRIEAEARDQAALRVAKLESAKSYRELAALADDMKDRGEKTTTDVIKILSQAAALDPDDFWSWVYLARLHAESGDTAQAAKAAGKARAVATDDREKSVALDESGGVQEAAGDLAGARQSFEASYQLRRGLAAANPTSAAAQRDVSVSLERLGGVQEAAGDLAGARQSFEASLQIDRGLAAANPTSAAAQRDVVVSLWRLASLPDGAVRWRDVADALRGMRARGILGPRDAQLLEEAERRAAQPR
jgi:tetratricopeptide (TPR) repeat protein